MCSYYRKHNIKVTCFPSFLCKYSRFCSNQQEKFYFCSVRKILYILSVILLIACSEKKTPVVTPWGTTIEEDTATTKTKDGTFTLDDIQQGGELIMLTISGPETYYDYHGHGMGLNYLLLERFATYIGVSLRVEMCKDTTELFKRLADGDADVIAFPVDKVPRGFRSCGVSTEKGKAGWILPSDSKQLAAAISSWFKPDLIAKVKNDENFLLSSRSIKRHVYSPMLNRSAGIISKYDNYFRMYAYEAKMDWRLMAAQCYQESTFDPNARSWAGACGLMQIMPTTADHLGLARADMFNPERNIAASARYMRELMAHYSDVGNPFERSLFALASYNGGAFHIRDAMNLARKNGIDPHKWNNVSEFVLKLQQPQYYSDPVVRHGYMRGTETVDYVNRIRERWNRYRGSVAGGSSDFYMHPVKAKRKNKFKI